MSKVAAVCVNISARMDREIFHYYIPPKIENDLKIGCRVLVPFGPQSCVGFVVAFPKEGEVPDLKAIKEQIDLDPVISQEMVEVAFWVSNYYLSSLYKVLEYILPPYARMQKEQWVKLVEVEGVEGLVDTLALLDPLMGNILDILRKGPEKLDKLVKKYGSKSRQILEDLETRDLVTFYWNFSSSGTKKVISYFRINSPELTEEISHQLKRAPKQRELFDYLREYGPQAKVDINQKLQISNSTYLSLIEKGVIEEYYLEEKRLPRVNEEFSTKKNWELNNYQQEAITTIAKALEAKVHKTFLIHGITGSGKTEVYLAAIKRSLDNRRGAILLVPEIALTPQVIGYFKTVLGDKVVVLHSNLSQGERLDAWESLRTGQAQVIVGVRSAIFAPVQNLGLIIIDEEHETTYKQSEPEPRYHARDVALKRAKINKGVLVLGSATPSIESYFRAEQGEFTLIKMPERVTENSLPRVKIVDLREEFKRGNKSIFSKDLHEAITTALEKKEQIIIFLNRRGFSTFVLCRECGTPLKCKNCSISLTYHATPAQMKCHYCNFTRSIPKRCSSCGSSFIRYFGTGTQQVEQEINKIWPEARVTRMDVDTTGNKNSHQDLLGAFKKGETNILVGTQMITKGLDFPNVTLVGVIAADTSLNLPDYTSGERTFQLLTQVAGRAGRGAKAGRVIIQTYNPEHYSIIAGKNQDFGQFYHQEISTRRMLGYPPFSFIVRILVSDLHEKNATLYLENFVQVIKDYQDIEILGPAQAPIARIKNRFRWQILLKGTNLEVLKKAADCGLRNTEKGKANKTLRVIVDVEPQSIL